MTTINLRKFNLAQDWWKASILMALLIGVLFAGGYAASQGAQVSLSFDIQAQIKEIEDRLDAPVNSSLAGMQKPYTEIISMVDSYYVRQNGTDGRLILPYSTNKTKVQEMSLGNVTTGSVYLKEMTLASGLTYGTTVLVIQQYQGQLSYYSNSALVYTVKAGSLNATVLYAGILNASTNYVQTYRLLVENGTSFPSSPSSGYIFFRTDWNLLTFYNGSAWTNCTTGSVDDLTVYLLKDGSRALTGNWNVGGSYGVYGATWLNATQMNAYTFYLDGQPLGWVQPYSFLIDYNASSGLYRSWHGANSTLASQSSNASAVINNAFGNLTSGRTWQETVFLKGNFSIDSPLLIRNFTELVIDGELWASASMEAMIECYDDTSFQYITVEGGILHGNKDFGVVCGGINFSTSGDSSFLTIKNVDVYYTESTSVHVQKSVAALIDDVNVLYCDDVGFNFSIVSDSKIIGIGTTSVALENVYLSYCQTSYFGDWYLGGSSNGDAQFFIVGSDNNEFSDIRTDNTYTHGVRLSQSDYNTFSNFHITEPIVAVKAAFWLQASFNNTASNFVIQKRGSAQTWYLGVYESDGSDMNLYSNFVINDCDTFCVTGLGGNSSLVHSIQNGVYVP
ncbi:hypothetical protein MUP79_05400 [Candidatus Bathyarchaeota archaeon]|nr:hypothetical protein [Candidatus Bathyarchaeota archaeon]